MHFRSHSDVLYYVAPHYVQLIQLADLRHVYHIHIVLDRSMDVMRYCNMLCVYVWMAGCCPSRPRKTAEDVQVKLCPQCKGEGQIYEHYGYRVMQV